MNIIKAIFFGLIEGITEWLPISSTAHMKVLNAVLRLDVSSEVYEVFEVVIQLGAIAALVLIFWNKIWPFGESKYPLGKGILSHVKKNKLILWLKIAVACLPVIIYEVLLEDLFDFVNEKNEMTIIALSLIIVGVVFIIVEALIRGKRPVVTSTAGITFLQALIIGLAQLIAAVFPGVSRSGATIIAALLMSISRPAATEFTFEVAIPVMFGASLMKLVKYGAALAFGDIVMMLVGCLVAFVVSLGMIRFILNYIRRNTFTVFGIYRIIAGIIIFVLFRK